MHVRDCCLIKPLSCGEDAPIAEAAKILREQKQRRILVVDKDEKPVGIISTTDMSNRVVAEGKDPASLKAADIMTAPLHVTCTMDCELKDIFTKMVDHETFFVPVLNNKKLYAVLTYGELVAKIQEEVLRDE